MTFYSLKIDYCKKYLEFYSSPSHRPYCYIYFKNKSRMRHQSITTLYLLSLVLNYIRKSDVIFSCFSLLIQNTSMVRNPTPMVHLSLYKFSFVFTFSIHINLHYILFFLCLQFCNNQYNNQSVKFILVTNFKFMNGMSRKGIMQILNIACLKSIYNFHIFKNCTSKSFTNSYFSHTKQDFRRRSKSEINTTSVEL